MVINVLPMQTLVYNVNKLLWMFRQSKSKRDKVRRTDSAVQMWEILFICFLCLSTDIQSLWSRETAACLLPKSINTNSKPAATPQQPHKRLTFPWGDPVTQWHASFLKSHVSCSAVHIPSPTPQHTESHVSGRELKQLGMGAVSVQRSPPSSPPLSHTLFTSFPFPLSFCLGMTEIGSRNVCDSTPFGLSERSGMTLRRAPNLHKNSNPPLTNTDSAHLSHLSHRAPPTSGQILLLKLILLQNKEHNPQKHV